VAAGAQAVVNLTGTHTTNGTQYTDNYWYNGSTEITSGSFTYANAINYNLSSDPGSSFVFGLDPFVSGQPSYPASSQNFDFADSVIAYSSNVGNGGPTTITNNTNISSTFAGRGFGWASGIQGIQYYGSQSGTNLTIKNAGNITGSVTSSGYSGVAAGVSAYCLYGGLSITNNSYCNITGSAVSPSGYYAAGIWGEVYYGSTTLNHYGTSQATASQGVGIYSGNAYAVGVDLFNYQGNINVTNTGIATGTTNSGTTSNVAYGMFLWAEQGSMTLSNSGTIQATSTTGAGGAAKALYCGANYNTGSVTNTGTIKGTGGSAGGWAMAIENDHSDAVNVTNSGTITHNNGLGVGVFIGAGTATINNNSGGSIYGGLTGISGQTWVGPVVVNNYGSIGCGSGGNGAMVFGNGNITVNLYNSATVSGAMVGGSGNNKLVFSLSGTLQKVNGQTATKGNNLANYGLGTSGNIVVNGNTYTWQKFTVSGTA